LDVVERGRGKPFPARANASDPFLLLCTSGTTSSPKAVSVTFNHFLSNARMCAAELGFTPDDRILCLAPYTHLYGLYALELGFAVGATACLLDVFTPAGFVEALKLAKPTILIAGPAHIAPCLQQKLFADVDFSELRFAVLRIDGSGDLVGRVRGSVAERPGRAGMGDDRASVRRLQPAIRFTGRTLRNDRTGNARHRASRHRQ
jgi:non-ribosomal peptide synthetase component E (peptide arylation enzyme)